MTPWNFSESLWEIFTVQISNRLLRAIYRQLGALMLSTKITQAPACCSLLHFQVLQDCGIESLRILPHGKMAEIGHYDEC
jgi:hypothetical protein